VGDFEAAAKEYATVLKKAGWDKSFTVWRSLTGANEYLLGRYYEKWADLGTGGGMSQDPKLKEVSADLTRIGQRIAQCEDKTESVIAQVLPELSLPRTAEPPIMISVLRQQVKPDKLDDYMDVLKTTLFPAVRKGELKTFSVARARYGAPYGQFIIVEGLNGWSDLDGPSPIVKGMGGREAYREAVKKLVPLLVESRWDVYRFQADLSHLAR
jgi:hypothetical protein